MRAHDENVLAVMHALAEVSSDASVDMLEAAVKRMLVGLERKFHFRRTALVCLNPEDWSIEHVFTARGREAATWLAGDFVSELQGIPRSSLNPAFLRSADPDANGRRYIQLKRNVPFKALGSIVIPHDGLAVMLVAEARLACRRTPVDSQALRLATELLALTIEKRAGSIELERRTRRIEGDRAVQIADGVGHELNNNLTAILGYGEMAAEAAPPSSPMHAYVEEILDAGRRAKLVVDGILRPDRAQKDTAMAFNAVEATAAIVPVLRMSLVASIRLHINLPSSGLTIAGSPVDFGQVLINFCRDAGKVVGSGAQLRLVVEEFEQRIDRPLSHGQLYPRKYVRISIIDMGGDCTGPLCATGTVQSGKAIGVSSAHKVSRSLDGAMHVRGNTGKGTRLELFFPCVDASLIPTSSGFAAGGDDAGKGERIAVIDPDSESRSVWEERAAASGYEPVGFHGIADLVDWCYRHGVQPDAVLVHDRGGAADTGKMEAWLSSEVAWTYINDGASSLRKEQQAIDRQGLLGKLVSTPDLARPI